MTLGLLHLAASALSGGTSHMRTNPSQTKDAVKSASRETKRAVNSEIVCDRQVKRRTPYLTLPAHNAKTSTPGYHRVFASMRLRGDGPWRQVKAPSRTNVVGSGFFPGPCCCISPIMFISEMRCCACVLSRRSLSRTGYCLLRTLSLGL